MTEKNLPPYVPLKRIKDRLPLIFPEGVAHRQYLVREISAKTIFVMLYAGAVEGYGRWVRPNQVTRMTDVQARRRSVEAREHWVRESLGPNKENIRGRWYADNTREPIRDETLRMGLIQTGAVIERDGLAITSSQPRYALRKSFADLFIASKSRLESLITQWRQEHLSRGAIVRLALVQQGLGKTETGRQVNVTFPNGSIRRMSPGPSSLITKAVIETFAPRFLQDPAVLFVSESRHKVVLSDQALSQSIGLDIDAQRVLPDIILVDLAPKIPLLVFVEVVATDGPVSEQRRSDLMTIARAAGFQDRDAAFVTALWDRSERGVFKKISADIAWGSFVWFASEPKHLVSYTELLPARRYLHQLRRITNG